NAIAQAAQEPKAEVAVSNVRFVGNEAHANIEVKMFPKPIDHPAQVWMAITEARLHSNVTRGENAGEDLHHAAVVRSLRRAGEAEPGKDAAHSSEQVLKLEPEWKRDNLRLVVFVQDPKTRHILGAASARPTQQ